MAEIQDELVNHILLEELKEESNQMTIEEAFQRSGGMGRYQIIRIIISLIMLMTAGIVPFTLPFLLQIKLTCPDDPTLCTPDHVCADSEIKYYYTNSDIYHYIISEFNLLCSFSFIAAIGSSYFLGAMLSGYVLGQISDILGRKLAILMGVLITIFGLIIFVSAHENNNWLFIVGIFFMGFSNYISPVVNFSLDGAPGKYSNSILTIIFSGWAAVLIILGSFMYLDLSWRVIIYTLLIIFLLMIIILYFSQEGPRYFISKNNSAEALRLFHHIASVNGVKEFPADAEILIEIKIEGNQQFTIIDVFKYPSVSYNFIKVSLLFIFTSSIYYGIILDLTKLSGSVQLNTIISGIAEILGYIVSGMTANTRLGRKGTFLISGLICGFAALLYSITQNTHEESAGFFAMLLFFLMKFGVTGCFHIDDVLNAELFPSVIRGATMGTFVAQNRLCIIFIPILVVHVHQPLYYFSAMAFFMTFVALTLPETRGIELQDHILELKEEDPLHHSSFVTNHSL